MIASAAGSMRLEFQPVPTDILPTNSVRMLFCDSDGYIWIPTYSGLVRYDGASTVVYGVNEWDNEVFDCHLNVVCESAGGILWIASEKGVYTLDKKTGHIAFADEDYKDGMTRMNFLGQNQGQGSLKPSNIANISLANFIGAFRNSNWATPEPTPENDKKHKFPWAIAWQHWDNFKRF